MTLIANASLVSLCDYLAAERAENANKENDLNWIRQPQKRLSNSWTELLIMITDKNYINKFHGFNKYCI